jgi:hypothetical protein
MAPNVLRPTQQFDDFSMAGSPLLDAEQTHRRHGGFMGGDQHVSIASMLESP